MLVPKEKAGSPEVICGCELPDGGDGNGTLFSVTVGPPSHIN